MKYSQKLKNPKWQKLRLEILKAHDWQCQSCGDKKSTLHVHHLQYHKGCEPWDYSHEDLTVLCETCHKYEHTGAAVDLADEIELSVESCGSASFLSMLLLVSKLWAEACMDFGTFLMFLKWLNKADCAGHHRMRTLVASFYYETTGSIAPEGWIDE